MVMRSYIILFIIVFLAGFLSHQVYSSLLFGGTEVPFSTDSNSAASPSDWVGENNIHVTSSKVTIDVKNASWAKIASTGSMEPIISQFSNTIEIIPDKFKLKSGDIISYDSDILNARIIHRVVYTGEDEEGW